jgi:hypothetical protein
VETIPSALMIIVGLIGVGYILVQAGGGYTDVTSGPRSGSGLVDQLAIGIAHAEGFYIPLSRPARNHNPGDISDSFGLATGTDAGGLSIFPDDQAGWDALTHKLQNILAGTSHTYSPVATVAQFANTWTGGDNPDSWADTVVGHLNSVGIPADTGTQLEDLAVS